MPPLLSLHPYRKPIHLNNSKTQTFVHLLLTIIFLSTVLNIFSLSNVNPPSQPNFPPSLKPLLSQSRPLTPSPSRTWRRPAILTAHILHIPTTHILTIFTAGLQIPQHNRTFHIIACLVANQTYPVHYANQGKVACRLPSISVPSPGALISIVLALDPRLREALAGPVQTHTFTFLIEPGDVYPIPASVDVHPAVRRAATPADKLMIVSSVTTWQSYLIDVLPAPSAPRHEFCLVTAMKQYPYLLPGWIRYYRRMGVDRIYIYDNNATSDLSVFESPFVEVVYWPHARSQLQIFTHFLQASRVRCKFVGFFDADEYVFIGDNGPAPLKRYVKHKVEQGFMQVSFAFLAMCNNGYHRIPKGELPELYTKRDLRANIVDGKSVIDVDAGWDLHTVHQAMRKNQVRYFNTTLELSPTTLDHNAMLVHFTKRSWEEYVLKQTVGSASPGTSRVPTDHLDANYPKKWYSNNDDGVVWYGMRDYFRKVMEDMDDGRSYLTFVRGSKVCRQRWCASCPDGPKAEQPQCR